MTQARRLTRIGASLTLVLTAATAFTAAVGGVPVLAQATKEAPHPIHIHSGTCDNLGDVVVPLTDVALNTAGETFGSPAVPVEESETDVEISLNDLLASPHAINIHESKDAIQTYIACGNIGGRVVDGDLLIGLKEINGSGHSGIAKLDTDDKTTDVQVYLAWDAPADATAAQDAAPAADTTAAAPAADATAAPAADTTAAAPAAVDHPVDIRDFAFSPTPVEIAVGDTVTWTNQDAVPHTATGDDRAVLQSGTISPGASFTQAFATAGTFPYFCEFHANMKGEIIVK